MPTDFDELKKYTTDNNRRSGLLMNVDNLKQDKISHSDELFTPAARLIERLVDSRSFIEQLQKPIKIGLVFAMWGEVNRIMKLSETNPNGEDCINDKLRSLNWLFKDTNVDWHIYAVDDDFPDGSGKAAISAVLCSELEHRITIRKLSEKHPFFSLPLSRMKNAAESTKGGAIIYGLQTAIEDNCDYVCYTDCDNSVHVGQIGVLLKDVIEKKVPATFGSSSVKGTNSYWHPLRSDIMPSGRIFTHIRNMVMDFTPPSYFLAEPFKLFDAKYLAQTILPPIEKFDFSFDTWMMLGIIADKKDVSLVPFSFFDSFEESNWHATGNVEVEIQKLLGLSRTLQVLKLPVEQRLIRLIQT